MYRYSKRNQKGIVGAILVLTILVVLGTLMLLFARINFNGKIVEIDNTIVINMKVDDAGRELLTLMESKGGDGVLFVKKLGNIIISENPGLINEIKSVLDPIHSSYVFKLEYSGMNEKTITKGDPGDADEYRTEIAVPGVQNEKVKAYVSIRRNI